MAPSRAIKPVSDVVIIQRQHQKESTCSCDGDVSPGTKSATDITLLFKNIGTCPSPIVPKVRTEKKKASTLKKVTSKKPPHDEQHTLEQIKSMTRNMSAQELKRRFPKAWQEHQTLKRKTRRLNGLELHPEFNKFCDFLQIMGPAPNPNSSIDRLDYNNPVYGPNLCSWTSAKGQANNRSQNVWVTWNNERHTLSQWADLAGIKYETLRKRHHRGWKEERMFADTTVCKYRPAPAHPKASPTKSAMQASSNMPSEESIPVMGTDGWPRGFTHARSFETGYNHMLKHTRKNGTKPISRAQFGAWVIGSQLRQVSLEIAAAGLQGYIYFRDQIPPDNLISVEQKASACPAIKQYYMLKPFETCFIQACMKEEEDKNARSKFKQSNLAQNTHIRLRNLVKTKPCMSPNDVWKFFAVRQEN